MIVVTDGDQKACKAVRTACGRLGLYPLLASAGNPTPISASEILLQIHEAPFDPVVVMVDDRGRSGTGKGERVLKQILSDDSVEIMGVLAVAAGTRSEGVEVDESVDSTGTLTDRPVNKDGLAEPSENRYLEGDTVEALRDFPNLTLIGAGDLGKMFNDTDDPAKGAPITTRCLQEILKHPTKTARTHRPEAGGTT